MRVVCVALLVAAIPSSAFAQRAPEIVIPGRPDVPVYINGVDASWGIIEGDFGLDRPDMAAPTIIYRPPLVRARVRVYPYYPMNGRRPGYGRLEIVPPHHHPLPPPARPYYREWSSKPEPSFDTPYPAPPAIIMPQISVPRWRHPHHRATSPGGSRTGP